MCGIAGIYHYKSDRPVSESQLKEMRDSMVHRGPDDADLYISGPLGLAHRRLSILDLSKDGVQPFHYQEGRYTIIFNGEIFNFQELRSDLEKRGYKFRTKTDTEVLISMYVEYGQEMLHSLNGMFAFAIWDSRERSLFIARDRVGIKPLYYSIQQDTIYFASEPKAIITAGVAPDLAEEHLEELVLFKYVAGANTVFKDIKRLLPGHTMLIKDKTISQRRWWNLPEIIEANREKLPSDPYGWFEETLYSSVKYRTISDVPVGVMLSGGLDSSSVAAALHHNGNKNLASFTVTFDNPQYNEGPLAKLVADKFNLEYHSVQIDGRDLLNRLEEATWYHDEPLIHQNDAQMLALSHYAKKKVTVLLSGEGGDELMGGYFRYKPLNKLGLLRSTKFLISILKKLPTKDIVNRFDKLDRYLSDSRLQSLLLLNASNVYPKDLKDLGISIDPDQFEYRNAVMKEAGKLYPTEPARQAMYLDMFTHMSSILDRNDRMTMGASIECRVPFLDYRFLEMIPALPSNTMLKGKKGKWLLYNSVGQKLPEEVLSFRKLGFSVPWEEYMKSNEAFRNFIDNVEDDPIFNFPVFKEIPVARVKELFNKNDLLGQTLIRQLFMVSIWQNKYRDQFLGTET